jgi:hypothetical protein
MQCRVEYVHVHGSNSITPGLLLQPWMRINAIGRKQLVGEINFSPSIFGPPWERSFSTATLFYCVISQACPTPDTGVPDFTPQARLGSFHLLPGETSD